MDWLTSEIVIGDRRVLWKKEVFEDKQRKQHEDRETSYFVIFCFIFVIKTGIVSTSWVPLCAIQLWDKQIR